MHTQPLWLSFFFFFFNDTAPTEIYTLSLHDALPICRAARAPGPADCPRSSRARSRSRRRAGCPHRSEEHTSELQSPYVISYAAFFFNDTATPEIYTLSLPDALPISARAPGPADCPRSSRARSRSRRRAGCPHAASRAARMPRSRSRARAARWSNGADRSEEHTSELQSPYVISYAVF